MPLTPKIEESRIQYALRGCKEGGLPVFGCFERTLVDFMFGLKIKR